MDKTLFESEELFGGDTLTVGAVKKILADLPDEALFYTFTDKEAEHPWPTRIIVFEK